MSTTRLEAYSDAVIAIVITIMVLELRPPDVDAIYQQALAAVQEPSEREGDPDRRGTVKDHFGNTWSLGTQRGE